VGFTKLRFEAPVLPLFEPPALMLCRSRRVSSALVFRPLIAAFGPATDDLRVGAIADFGISGWIAFLSGSGPDSADDPTLEFWADPTQIKAATVTNKKAILHLINWKSPVRPFRSHLAFN
jgi:hypothetical protein